MKTYGYARISTMKQSIQRQINNIKEHYPDAIIVTETYTGTKIERPEWDKLYKKIKSGDTIVFDEVSRMSRNAEDGIKVYEELFNKGINLIFLSEPHINTSVYREKMSIQIEKINSTGSKATDKLLESIMSALHEYTIDLAKEQIRLAFEQAQAEVDYLHKRTSKGVQTAKDNGKQVGRAVGQKFIIHKEKPIKELIRKYSKDFNGTNNDAEVMAILSNKTVTINRTDNKTGRIITREVSAKLARNTYYKYKAEMKEE